MMMRNCVHIPTCCALLAILDIPNGYAQTSTRKLPNLGWTLDYAVPSTQAPLSSTQPKVQRQLVDEPRLISALRLAFPQRQWFLKDHGRFWSMPDLVHTFLSASVTPSMRDSTWSDDDRYVTEQGCMMHACFDRGMLWIDTDSTQPALIFVATDVVTSADSGNTHAWVFVSNQKLGNALPAAFQRSAGRWYSGNQAYGDKQQVILATIVTPDGGMRDVGFADIIGKAAGATQ